MFKFIASNIQRLRPGISHISLLFLGFFPGALLMYSNREQNPAPVLLEYDVMILRVPSAADVSKIPDFSDWNNPVVRRTLIEQDWRILHEPKLVSAYHCDIDTYLGPIPGLEGASLTGSQKSPEYNIRFVTQVHGPRLQTRVVFAAERDDDAPAVTHNLLHYPGNTTAVRLSPQHQRNGFRYFLLFKVTPQNRFQIGGPTVAPTSGTTAP